MHGVARFVTRVISGIGAGRYYFEYSVNGKKSAPSSTFALKNPITAVDWLAVDGTAQVGTSALTVAISAETFPADVVVKFRARVLDAAGNAHADRLENETVWFAQVIEEGTGRKFDGVALFKEFVSALSDQATKAQLVSKLDPTFHCEVTKLLGSCQTDDAYADAWAAVTGYVKDGAAVGGELAAGLDKAVQSLKDDLPSEYQEIFMAAFGTALGTAAGTLDRGQKLLQGLHLAMANACSQGVAVTFFRALLSRVTEFYESLLNDKILAAACKLVGDPALDRNVCIQKVSDPLQLIAQERALLPTTDDLFAAAALAQIPVKCDEFTADMEDLFTTNVADISAALASSVNTESLSSLFKLFVSGGQKILKRNSVSSTGSIQDAPLGRVTSNHVGNGTHEFTLTLASTAAKTYYVDVYANGIPAPLEVEVTFTKKELTGNSKVIVTVVIYLLCFVIMLANTRLNGSNTFVGGLSVSALLVAAINISVIKEASVLLENEMRFYVVLVVLVSMTLAFVWELIRKFSISPQPFSEQRQHSYIRYVQRLYRLPQDERMALYPPRDENARILRKRVEEVTQVANAIAGTKFETNTLNLRLSVVDKLAAAKQALKEANKSLAGNADASLKVVHEDNVELAVQEVLFQQKRLAIAGKLSSAHIRPVTGQ